MSKTWLSHTDLTSENTQPPKQYLQFNFSTLACAQGFLVARVCFFLSVSISLSLRKLFHICLWLLQRDGAPRMSRPPEIRWDLAPPWTGHSICAQSSKTAPKLWEICSSIQTQRMDSETLEYSESETLVVTFQGRCLMSTDPESCCNKYYVVKCASPSPRSSVTEFYGFTFFSWM
jgi:hypothetical protein